MVIQNSTVGMQTTYSAFKKRLNSVSYTSWGNIVDASLNNSATTLPSAMDSVQNDTQQSNTKDKEKDLLLLMEQNNPLLVGSANKDADDSMYEGEDKVEYDSLKNLMELLFQEKQPTEKVSAQTMFQRLLRLYRDRANELMANMISQNSLSAETTTSVLVPTQVWGTELTITDFYQETESSTFASAGTVVTEDGREISFSVSAEMSRSFESYSNASIDYVSAYMVDPLVVNLGSDTTKVSDQKFLFDIDADGKEDNISLLAKHCAFLAYDKNNDGKVNDGSELFGTKTGDGFGELAVFDMDHNGWIDEKDEIFNHLRIWKKDEEGNDELLALGVAGIGAIYLGSKQTQFSLNNKETNSANAEIKETGIYLTEDGKAGTIQHVDFAKESN